MIVCFDVDDTLIRWEGEGRAVAVPQREIVELADHLSRSPEHTVIVWSGGGEEYARGWRNALGLHGCHAMAKDTQVNGRGPDLVIDNEEGWGRLQLILKRGNGPAVIGGKP